MDEIFEFLGDRRDFFSYHKDLKTKKAVERNLEIIGEAVNRILKKDDSYELYNAKNIIGTRNQIIHSNNNISDEVIWTIVNRDLPNLNHRLIKF
ncbi:MAG: HepT-like ribonuclease domain-containing protein [bacterium]|nr:HepT-like ribonuclease domain-containing protein [bacterium]